MGVEPKETISASKKLGEDDASTLLKKASYLIVAKAKNVTLFDGMESPSVDEAELGPYKVARATKKEFADHMLGSTGNLRAPTLVIGKHVVVGFNEAVYSMLLA